MAQRLNIPGGMRAAWLSVAVTVLVGCAVGCSSLSGAGRVRPSEYAGKPFRAQIGFQNVKIGVVWVGYEDAAVVIVDNKDKILFKQSVPRPISQGSYELTLDPKAQSLIYAAKSYPGLARGSAETVPMAGAVKDSRQVIPIPDTLIHPEAANPKAVR